MIHAFSLRPAGQQDFSFCEQLYFEGMGWIIEALNLHAARQHENFALQWRLPEVRIIAVGSHDVGWLQTAPVDGTIFLAQLYLAQRFQRQGFGSHTLRALIAESARSRKAITLGVVKINPARQLYERHGFHVTHADEHKVYMRREPDSKCASG